jgi:hypothetical protein
VISTIGVSPIIASALGKVAAGFMGTSSAIGAWA